MRRLMDRLTELVISYKETRNEVLVSEILKLSEGLIWGVFKYYKIENLPAPVQEDIAADCRSIILTKTMDAFNASRGAKFSTFYTWRLKSHVRAQKEIYLRRRNLRQALSLDTLFENADSSKFSFSETITHPNYSYRNLTMHKRQIAEIFS